MHPKCAGCHAAPDMGNGSSTLTSGSSGWHLVQANPANANANSVANANANSVANANANSVANANASSDANANASSDAGGKTVPSWWCPKCWRKRRALLRKSA